MECHHRDLALQDHSGTPLQEIKQCPVSQCSGVVPLFPQHIGSQCWSMKLDVYISSLSDKHSVMGCHNHHLTLQCMQSTWLNV